MHAHVVAILAYYFGYITFKKFNVANTQKKSPPDATDLMFAAFLINYFF